MIVKDSILPLEGFYSLKIHKKPIETPWRNDWQERLLIFILLFCG